jgi:hypothetical protein
MERRASMMRSAALGLLVAVLAVGCGSDSKRHTVDLADVKLSSDRRVLTVSTYYPVGLFCAKQPAGLTVDVRDGVAVVSAYVREIKGSDCTAECATVVQTLTLHDPLPEGVKFAPPADALRGCGPH